MAETNTGNIIALPLSYGPPARRCRQALLDLYGGGVVVLQPMGRKECLTGFAHQAYADAEALMEILSAAGQVVLVAPSPTAVRGLAEKGGACPVAQAAMHAMLWGVKTGVVLDFELPRAVRGTFFETLGESVDALRAMGMEVNFCCGAKQEARGRALITEDDVKAAHGRGEARMAYARGAIITPLARDAARELQIRLERAEP